MLSKVAILGILKADGLRLQRDRFLLGTAVYLIGISAVMRWALPWLVREVQVRLSFDLRPWLPLMVSHLVVVLASITTGFLGGFLLLESREDRTVRALLVSGVSLPAYLLVFFTVMFVATTLLTLGQSALIGQALPPTSGLIVAALAGAPFSAVMALYIATFADNKVEALAYTKFVSVTSLIPAGSYFLSEPWQWIAGIYPQYWAAKVYWTAQASQPGWALWALGGLLCTGVWLFLLGRRFLRVAHR